jgi:site-specific DNA recombinase
MTVDPTRPEFERIPVIGYVRVSMAREEMLSPAIQRTAIEEWARRTGRRIVLWIEDLDLSGRNFRRKIMGGIERLEAGEAREIGVYRYDRWGRNAFESLANIARVERAGGQVRSVTEPLDAETSLGKYNRLNALGLAEMQSDVISDNWKAALANRVGREIHPSGAAQFGYLRLGRVRSEEDPTRFRRDRDDTKGERYEADFAGGTADVLVEMYDLYITENMGFRKIAVWLNTRGLANTRGAPWSDVTVRNVLDSGFGAGLLRIHDKDCRCGKPSSCRKRVYVPGAHEPILDEPTWQAYLALRARRKNLPPRSRYPAYPLTGLILCGHCCSFMSVQNASYTPGHTYRCGRWKQYGDVAGGCRGVFPQRLRVEAAVREKLAEWADDIDGRTAVREAGAAVRVTAVVDRERIARALVATDAALTRLAVNHASAPMPETVYAAARAELLAKRAQAEAELEAAPAADAPVVDYLPIVRSILEGWDLWPATQVRDMLAQIVRHVKVTRQPGVPSKSRHPPLVAVTPVWEPCDCVACERPR